MEKKIESKEKEIAQNSFAPKYLEIARIARTISASAQEIEKRAKESDFAYFARKEFPQELRDIEIACAYVRLNYRALKMEKRLQG